MTGITEMETAALQAIFAGSLIALWIGRQQRLRKVAKQKVDKPE